MDKDFDKELSKKYCPRFGMIAVSKGFTTPEQLKKAIAIQIEDDLSGKKHRLIGRIFFEEGWMTPAQIETVLNELFSKERERSKEGG
ncbi:MAG: hypothetical protein HY809_03315 [Nitrospirae bacterium]|nr:hypothetical protein [Nitrospirota bacterium]